MRTTCMGTHEAENMHENTDGRIHRDDAKVPYRRSVFIAYTTFATSHVSVTSHPLFTASGSCDAPSVMHTQVIDARHHIETLGQFKNTSIAPNKEYVTKIVSWYPLHTYL